jgi:hypothetical protein
MSAIQTFYAFEGRSKSHTEFAMECYAIKRQIDLFFQRYHEPPTHPKDQQESRDEQRAIDQAFAEARRRAPIIPLSLRRMAK